MPAYADSMQRLIKELSRWPGIGSKSAERIVFHILKSPAEESRRLSELILKVKQGIFFCEKCNSLSEAKICHICSDNSRDKSVVCVVEEPKDVISLEKSGEYKGLYHVLLGALSPIHGIGPKDLRINSLIKRVKEDRIKEIILATNTNAEGEATALYLAGILKPMGVKVSRIARGIPVGSSLEYADHATLARALAGRGAV